MDLSPTPSNCKSQHKRMYKQRQYLLNNSIYIRILVVSTLDKEKHHFTILNHSKYVDILILHLQY